MSIAAELTLGCPKKADPADLSKSSVKAITNYHAKKALRTIIPSLLHK